MTNALKMRKWMRAAQFMVIDAFSIAMTYAITIFVFRVFDISIDYRSIFMILPIIIVLKIIFYTAFGLYRMLLDHFGFEDGFRIFMVVVVSNVFLSFFFGVTQIEFVRWMAFIFIAPLEMMLITFPRIVKRAISYLRTNMDWRSSLGARTLIIGAGDGGEMVLKEIYRNKNLPNIPIAFIDDDFDKIGSRLSGIDILGPITRTPEYIDQLKIEEVIIAIKNISYRKLQGLLKMFSEKHVRIKRLPLMEEMDSNQPHKIIDVKIEDLLERDEIHLDNDGLEAFINQKTVLVTGGGGSIGSELCRQIIYLKPKKLVIFDIYENSTYDIQQELHRVITREKLKSSIEVVIGSVYNYERLKQVFEKYKPQLVFHAAAYKHVPLMEDSPQEAIRTNIIGTYNTAKLSDDYRVQKFTLVSSDKAVRPTNIMGATKRYAELIIQHFDQISEKTSYSAVRFGNVLGSNGSVIPLFKKQIEEGGPITVTHPDITRFFMTIPESVSLILQSAVYADGGEIFVLDMGEPVKIKDLAEKMIRLAGYRPYVDIDILYSGLRKGEKLFEELLVDPNVNIKTPNKKIFIEDHTNNGKTHYSDEDFTSIIADIDTKDGNVIKKHLANVIKSYKCSKE